MLGLGEDFDDGVGVFVFEGLLESVELSGEASDGLGGVLGVGHEDIAPDTDGAGGDTGGIEEAFAAEEQFPRVAGADEGGGEGVGEVADAGEDAVVPGGRHGGESQAEGLPELAQALEVVLGGACGGGKDAVGVVEEVGAGEVEASLFGAGHGVGADEVDPFGQVLPGPADGKHLGGAYIGDEALVVEMGGDLRHDFGEGADGAGEDDQLGAFDGLGQVIGDSIDGSYAGGLVSGDGTMAVADAFDLGQVSADGQADGAAEQA